MSMPVNIINLEDDHRALVNVFIYYYSYNF